MTIELLFAFLALFFAAKAIEDQPYPLDAVCSIASWICAGVAVVLFII